MALTESEILDAACTILDQFGLTDLTMRRLGEQLDVRAGALYHHIPNKQTLLALVADRIVASVEPTDGPWPEAVTDWAHALRTALLAHRDSADLVASTRAMGLGRHDPAAVPSGMLCRAGLAEEDATDAAAAMLHFVLGHVAEEQARLDWERFGQPDPGRHPTATEESFEAGLALLTAGLAARFTLL